jgi:hypothetical protein
MNKAQAKWKPLGNTLDGSDRKVPFLMRCLTFLKNMSRPAHVPAGLQS